MLMNQLLYIGNLAIKSKLETAGYTICLDNLTNWRASWLCSPFINHIWVLKNYKTAINFHAVFRNGESLLEPKYSSLLNTIKKVVFLKRSGHLADLKGKQSTRSSTQYELSRVLISFAQYLVNHNYYEVDKGFSSLTKERFDKLVSAYVDAGRDAISGHFDIVEAAFRKLQLKNDTANVINNKGVVDYTKFSDATGCDGELIKSLSDLSRDKLKQYCLFKEHLQSVSGNKTEFSNATPLKSERKVNHGDEDIPSKVSDTAIGSLVSAANTLSNFKIPLQHSELAFFEPFIASSNDYAESYYKSRRTPNIPTEIALTYIDSAVEFVYAHGDNIVSALSDCMRQITKEVERRGSPRKDHVCKHIVVPQNSTTERFNVHRFNKLSSSASIKEKRGNVTLEILVEVYQSAVFILLATFACKRFQDVIPIKQAANTIGYFGLNSIKFGLAKADPVEVLRAVGRPVPKVVADAFDNLVGINKLLLSEPSNPSNYLFQNSLSLPSNLDSVDNGCMSRYVLIRRIIQYADFVEIPTVELNGLESRWYLNRIHMLRRFFACAYYQVLDKQHLPALTWLMGHSDTKQTMHYVTQNMSNVEMSDSDAAEVIASAISEGGNVEDVVKNLSDHLGEPTMDFKLVKNKKRLEKRIQELFDNGYRIVREHSGDLIILSNNHDAPIGSGECGDE